MCESGGQAVRYALLAVAVAGMCGMSAKYPHVERTIYFDAHEFGEKVCDPGYSSGKGFCVTNSAKVRIELHLMSDGSVGWKP